MNKEYLGDSVYASIDEWPLGGQLILTVENGYGPSETICLEPEVIQALLSYIQRHFGDPK